MLVITSTTARELLPQNRMRKSFVVQNIDSSINVFIKKERNSALTVTSADFDFRLGPGASIALNSMLDGTESIQDRFTVIAESGTPSVSIFETEDITR